MKIISLNETHGIELNFYIECDDIVMFSSNKKEKLTECTMHQRCREMNFKLERIKRKKKNEGFI